VAGGTAYHWTNHCNVVIGHEEPEMRTVAIGGGDPALASMTVVEIALDADIPQAEAEAVQQSVADLTALIDQPLSGLRLTVRLVTSERVKRRYIADARATLDGRAVAAHSAGTTALEAADSSRDRLLLQALRVAGKTSDGKRATGANEPLAVDPAHRPEARLKPPANRRIVHRRTYISVPLGTVDAVRDLLDIDAEFMLFVHARTREDVTAYLRDDGRIGLLFPEGSVLADEDDIVVPKPSRYPGPITLSAARIEMDFLDHRFLYFVDAKDRRGKVIYLRHDGDYGLVEPK
jgi:hypothetical protein